MHDMLIVDGSECKALDTDGRIGGYLIRFGDPEHTDASKYRDFFTPETDFGLDVSTKSRLLYHHGLDPDLGTRSLGVAELKADDTGIWMEAQLKLRDAYEHKILEMVKAKKQGLSSGTARHLVRREKCDNGAHKILSWPLGLDASITPAPADPRAEVAAIKSLDSLKMSPLGEHVGAMAASAAMDRLSGILSYRVTDAMRDETKSRAERIALCKACLDDYHATALKLVDALTESDDTDESAVKALIHTASTRLHAGLRLTDHLESVHAAVTGLHERLAAYAAMKRDEGRRVPADRREAIKALADDLAALWSATAPPADANSLRRMRTEFDLLDVRLAGLMGRSG